MQKTIKKYLDMFETKTRGDESIVVMKRDASEDLKQSMFDTHDEWRLLPHDWIYETYQGILESLSEHEINTIDDVEEVRCEIVDGMVDIYTHDLTEWINSSICFVGLLDEVVKGGATENVLGVAQYEAIDIVYGYVLNLLRGK